MNKLNLKCKEMSRIGIEWTCNLCAYNSFLYRTCGLTPNIRRDGGTFTFCGICTCPKSTVNASHQMPKCPISKTVKSPGKVKTTVLRSYRLKGTSFPFSSGTLMPCGDGLEPRPTQNLASAYFEKYYKNFVKDC